MEKKIIKTLLFSFLMFVPLMVFSADAPATRLKGKTVDGEAKRLGNGVVWSWVEYGSEGTPVAIGVTLTETALSGLPESPPSDIHFWDYELSLPKQAQVPPFDHIAVDWNPVGHIPPGVYDVPHFDFHFYMITSNERSRITVKKEDMAKHARKPAARYIPAGYILPDGTQEPRMGSHWVDPEGPEFHGQPFTKTFIYGSYNGKVVFYEPMVSLAHLKEHRTNSTETIKLPASYEKPGYYPVAYSIKYDAARREYTVSLDGLTRR
jgi:hypothetical protein